MTKEKKSKKKTINFAIVGCGRIAERHAEHIAKQGKLVAVCDIKPERTQLFVDKYNTSGYGSIDELLHVRPHADVVAICTPNGLHAEHAVKALRAGYHVLVEKPMALTVRDCERMILESEKAGRKLFIVKQNRYNPPIVFAKELIDKGSLGKILSVQINCFWNRNEEYYRTSDWKGTKKLDGGTLYTQFSHFVDLIHWMFGDISITSALTGNLSHPYIEIDDHGASMFELEGGGIGVLKYTVNSYGKNMEGSVAIFGEKGTLKIGGQYLNMLEYLNVEGVKMPELPTGNAANDYGTYKGSMSNHDKVYENLVNVLNGDGVISTSGIEGMKTVEIINRIYEAARK
jgi:UDP-N-acetyl-2-amino-2-deoxyglucuronate dehydrogenase